MDFYISQNINIHILRIGSVTNSSVLQIGSSGCIHTTSHLYNTGGFPGPAPQLQPPGSEQQASTLVPLGSTGG